MMITFLMGHLLFTSQDRDRPCAPRAKMMVKICLNWWELAPFSVFISLMSTYFFYPPSILEMNSTGLYSQPLAVMTSTMGLLSSS